MRTLSTAKRSIAYGASWFSTALFLQILNVRQAFAAFGGPIPNIDGADEASGVRGSVESILNWVLGFLALIAVIFIVIGGFRIMMSGGNEESVTKGRKTIFMALVGIVIIFFAKVIVSFFVNLPVSGNGTTP